MRICLVLEGCYPYVFGGVSTWMHQYINQMQEHEFVLWVIGGKCRKKEENLSMNFQRMLWRFMRFFWMMRSR